MQMKALATYSDGTTGALPDAEGNKVTSWTSSNHKVAVVSTKGHATATDQGPVSIGGMIGSPRSHSGDGYRREWRVWRGQRRCRCHTRRFRCLCPGRGERGFR